MDNTAEAPLPMHSIGYFSSTEAKKLAVSNHFPRPTPGPDEVLIEVHAFGLNFADVLARKGLYPDAPSYPYIPGYEVAGKIVQIGAQATQDGFPLKEGDKVFAFTLFGGYAEYAVSKHVAVFPLPEGMSYAEGASLPVNLATAYHALFFTGTLFPGDRVLIHAGAGGVGQIAVQMAKHAGCEVFVTAGSDAKLSMLRDRYGVDHGIDYKKHNFASEVRRITGVARGGCLDVILDPIGGSQLKDSVDLLRANGRIVSYGATALNDRNSFTGFFATIPKVLSMLTFNTIDLLSNSKSFVGLNMLAIAKDRPEVLRRSVMAGLELILDGKIHTVLSKQYDWRQVGVAQRDMETRQSTGKLVFIVKRPENPGEDFDSLPIDDPIDINDPYKPSSTS